MATMINSGIIYLENFVEKNHLLPADLSRQLGYVRTLDERLAELRGKAEAKLELFLKNWIAVPTPLPDEANKQRLEIDAIHAEMIHLQEEKMVFVGQIDDMLKTTVDELSVLSIELGQELDMTDPADGMFSASEGQAGSHGRAIGQNTSAPSLAQTHSGMSGMAATASMPGIPSGMGVNMDYASYGDATTSHMMANRHNLAKGNSITSRGSMGGMHPHGLAGPQGSIGGSMPPYASNASPMRGLYSYSKQNMASVPSAPHPAAQQYFVPVDPTMQPSSRSPQSRFGRPLTQQDIGPSLVDKQAELLWTDDNMWYLVKITKVDLQARTADVIYVTGDTENGVNLEDLAFKNEMRLLPG